MLPRLRLAKKANLAAMHEELQAVEQILAGSSLNETIKQKIRKTKTILMSYLKQLDADIDAFHRGQHALTTRVSTTTTSSSSTTTAAVSGKDYRQALRNCLGSISHFVRDEVKSMPAFVASRTYVNFVAKLNRIATVAEEMQKLVPDRVESSNSQTLGHIAKKLGGVYMAIRQGNLAVIGGEYKKGVLQASGGICAGMVLDWGEQVVKNGTPKYPITARTSVQINQVTQRNRVARDYEKVATSNYLDEINLYPFFENLLEGEKPYYLAIRDADGGHALGIRKHKDGKFIEIFDPNYGYFFFRDSNAAATFFGVMLDRYRASNFPCETLTVYKHKVKQSDVPESKFPPRSEVNDAFVTPHTEEGYDHLIKGLKGHAAHVRRVALATPGQADSAFPLVLKAFHRLGQHLTDQDSAEFLNLLKSVLDPQQAYDADGMGKYIKQNVFEFVQQKVCDAACKQKFEKLIKGIESAQVRNIILNPDRAAIVKKAKELKAKMKMAMASLSAQMREKMGPSDRAEYQLLQFKSEILRKRCTRFDKSDFEHQVYAGAVGAEGGAGAGYDMAEAKKVFADVFAISFDRVSQPAEEKRYLDDVVSNAKLQANKGHIKYIAGLEKALRQLDDVLRHRDVHGGGFAALTKRQAIAFKRDLIEHDLEVLDRLKELLFIDESDNQDLVQGEYAKLFVLLVDKLELLKDVDFDEAAGNIEMQLDAYRAGFTKDQVTKLANIYAITSTKTAFSMVDQLDHTLSNAYPQPNTKEHQYFDALRKEAQQLKCDLIAAINPTNWTRATDKDEVVTALVNALHRVSPTSVDEDNNVAVNKLVSEAQHVSLLNLKSRIQQCMNNMSNLDPAFKALLQSELNKVRDVSINTQSDFLGAFLVHLKEVKKLLPIEHASISDLHDNSILEAAINSRCRGYVGMQKNERANAQSRMERDELKLLVSAICRDQNQWVSRAKRKKGMPTGVTEMLAQANNLDAMLDCASKRHELGKKLTYKIFDKPRRHAKSKELYKSCSQAKNHLAQGQSVDGILNSLSSSFGISLSPAFVSARALKFDVAPAQTARRDVSALNRLFQRPNNTELRRVLSMRIAGAPRRF